MRRGLGLRDGVRESVGARRAWPLSASASPSAITSETWPAELARPMRAPPSPSGAPVKTACLTRPARWGDRPAASRWRPGDSARLGR
eukprot:10544844-Alexandrium_andersonii.AAC.1